MNIVISVPGIPSPGGSKKAFFNKHTGRASVVDAGGQKTKNWRAIVAHCAQQAMREAMEREPSRRPLTVSVVFYMPRIKAHYNKKGLRHDAPAYHSKKPDATKLWRSTEDALTGIVWADDAQIVQQTVTKVYANESAGAVITVSEAV